MSFLTTALYLLGPPVLLLISIPLVVFTCVTTSIAISLLAIRVSVVYAELGLTLLSAYFIPPPSKPLPRRPALPPLPHHHQRAGSLSLKEAPNLLARMPKKSNSSASLLWISDSARDLGSVGGWKDYEEHEEALWMGINKRLELPARSRRHVRRHTGEGAKWMSLGSPGGVRTSPLQSRIRTPQASLPDGEGYFTPQPILRPLSSASEPLVRSPHHSRRSSSQISGPLNMRSSQTSLNSGNPGQ